MTIPEPWDRQQAHQVFSTGCFNQTWELIDKTDRSTAESVEMLLLTATSAWHWTQREDVTDRNLAIAWWQMSRVLALLGAGELALQYARFSLQKCDPATEPFYAGYAYEALTRAACLLNQPAAAQGYRAEAEACWKRVEDPQAREALAIDLSTLPDIATQE